MILIRGCKTSTLLVLELFHLRRTDTIVCSELNKPPFQIQCKPPSLLTPPPPPPASNGIKINKPPGGVLIEDLRIYGMRTGNYHTVTAISLQRYQQGPEDGDQFPREFPGYYKHIHPKERLSCLLPRLLIN